MTRRRQARYDFRGTCTASGNYNDDDHKGRIEACNMVASPGRRRRPIDQASERASEAIGVNIVQTAVGISRDLGLHSSETRVSLLSSPVPCWLWFGNVSRESRKYCAPCWRVEPMVPRTRTLARYATCNLFAICARLLCRMITRFAIDRSRLTCAARQQFWIQNYNRAIEWRLLFASAIFKFYIFAACVCWLEYDIQVRSIDVSWF